METLIMHPKNKEQLTALKAIAKAWNISIETTKSPYKADFVAKIKKSAQEFEDGDFTRVEKAGLQDFLGVK